MNTDTQSMRTQLSGLFHARGPELAALWRRLRVRLTLSMQQSASYSRANMLLVGVVGIASHPIYYFCWTHVYPQDFENVWLRAFSMVVMLPMLFEERLSRSEFWRRKLTIYWFLILVYQLPFFFVFMSFMNDFSPVWALSTMSACLLLVLLVFDWLMIFLLAFIGCAFAVGCFLLFGGSLDNTNTTLNALLPIYLFTLIAGSAFNYKTELIAREKLAAITATVGTVAHELRTPLLGIRSGARGLQGYLPSILEGYEMARAHGLPVRAIRTAHYRQMHAVLDRINSETEYTNLILDMLLINSSRTTIDESSFEPISVTECVDAALARYPFHSERERQRVAWDADNDFVFSGSRLLMVHVLFNLFKNALYFLAQVEDGHIRIWIEREEASSGWCRLHFRDTGPGIRSEIVPHIFERFYSAMPKGQGTGIGLAFARLVMDSFGGDIRCHSELGRYTEFVMTFPAIDENNESN